MIGRSMPMDKIVVVPYHFSASCQRYSLPSTRCSVNRELGVEGTGTILRPRLGPFGGVHNSIER